MTRFSLLLLTLSLILSVNTAAGQNVNLTGKWAGTATPGGTDFAGGETADVSASITQTASAITATLVITSGDLSGTFTGNGVISGSSLTANPSSDDNVTVSGTITSTGISGTGEDVSVLSPIPWSGSFIVSGNHMTGSATGADGNTVSWSLYLTSKIPVTPQENPGQGNPSEPQTGCPIPCQGSQGDPVNTAFGSFSERFDDFFIPGRGMALSFIHTYNSVFAAVKGALGFGWTHSYAMNLVQGSGGVVTINQENGSQVIFTPNSGGGYSAPPRVIATLVKNTDGSFSFARRAREFFKFSSTGKLMSEHDLNGYTTTFAYNGAGQLATVTDPAGRTLTFIYNGSQLTSVTDPLGRKVTFAYDANGNLSMVTDVAGGQTTFTYSTNHLLLTRTDPRKGVITNTYDSSNRVIAQMDQLGRKTTFTYATGSTTTTDPKGNVTKEQYNTLNQRVAVTQGLGTTSAATWRYAYDPAMGAITSITDPNGHISTSTYDGSGNLLTSTDALGRQTTRTWDAMNDLTSVTDPLGVTTFLSYDGNGNLLNSFRQLIGTFSSQIYTYQYGDTTHPGDVTGIVDPDGNTTTFAYDADGNRIRSTDPLGHVTHFSYNAVGFLTSLTDARGKTTTFAYNNFGDLTSATDPLAHKTTCTYDGNRKLTSLTDADGHITKFTYDAANEQTTTTRANGTTLQTLYNPDGTVAKTTNGAGNSTVYGYDPLGRLISVTDPLGRSTKYSYDLAGNERTLTDPAGQVTTRTYDAANELLSLTYSDGKTHAVTFAYDADGQRTSMTDGTGTSSWSYDSLHRITSTKTGAGATVTYAYDLKGQLTKITYPGGTHAVTRIYDAAGRMTSVTDWLGNKTTFAYDLDGNLVTETLPVSSGITVKYSYDANSRLTGIVDAKGATSLATFSHTRDALGQLSGATETGVPSAGTDTYTYTALNQLSGVNLGSYSYDAADNVTGLIVPAQVSLQYDTGNELIKLTSGTQVTNFNYDTRGNRLSRTPPSGSALTYAYDQANRMTGFGSNATYHYAGDGLRMSKTVGATTEAFTWDRSGILPFLLADGTTNYVYGPDGSPLEQVNGSGALFYLHDQQGSTRLLVNSSGVVQDSYTYDAYGNVIGKTGTVANPFGYDGEFADAESGLIYLRARYYDPATSQFLTHDPIRGGSNLYGFAANNPLNLRDPRGKGPWVVVAAVITVAIAAVVFAPLIHSEDLKANNPSNPGSVSNVNQTEGLITVDQQQAAMFGPKASPSPSPCPQQSTEQINKLNQISRDAAGAGSDFIMSPEPEGALDWLGQFIGSLVGSKKNGGSRAPSPQPSPTPQP
jgi:RHS repeat-associated protein